MSVVVEKPPRPPILSRQLFDERASTRQKAVTLGAIPFAIFGAWAVIANKPYAMAFVLISLVMVIASQPRDADDKPRLGFALAVAFVVALTLMVILFVVNAIADNAAINP